VRSVTCLRVEQLFTNLHTNEQVPASRFDAY